MIGKTFSKWTVIAAAPRDKAYRKMFLCKCDCGTKKIVNEHSLKSGGTHSCGCNRAEANTKTRTTHGKTNSRIYSVWHDIKDRCHNPKNKRYSTYGGRGISVCDDWLNSFESFYQCMGDVPFRGAQIDRIDNNKGYNADNCRWVTQAQNARNKSNHVMIDVGGKVNPVFEIADKFGISARIIRQRLSRGWTAKKTLEQPVRGRSQHANI